MENVDIDITYDGKELKAIPSEDIVKGSGVTSSQQVTVGGKHAHVFFVTHDNKPEHLIQTLQILLQNCYLVQLLLNSNIINTV